MGSRTEPDFLCRCVEAAIKAGATTINVPDTVGYAVPEDMTPHLHHAAGAGAGRGENRASPRTTTTISGLRSPTPSRPSRAGVRQIECTINGIGERAGNAALEEIVMAIRTRPDSAPYIHSIDTTQILRVSKLLSGITGFDVQPNKAIVGRNAFRA